MQLDYDLTPEDYIRFNRNYLARTPAAKRGKWQFILVPALVWVCFGLFTGMTEQPADAIPCVLLAAVWICIALPLWKLNVNQQLKRFINANRTGDFFGRHTVVIDAAGFSSAVEDSKAEFKWKGIAEVVAAEHGIYVYVNPKVAYIIPNSAFATQAQREEFLEATLVYREQAAGLTAAV